MNTKRTAQELADCILGHHASHFDVVLVQEAMDQARNQARNEALEEAVKQVEVAPFAWRERCAIDSLLIRIRALKKP